MFLFISLPATVDPTRESVFIKIISLSNVLFLYVFSPPISKITCKHFVSAHSSPKKKTKRIYCKLNEKEKTTKLQYRCWIDVNVCLIITFLFIVMSKITYWKSYWQMSTLCLLSHSRIWLLCTDIYVVVVFFLCPNRCVYNVYSY